MFIRAEAVFAVACFSALLPAGLRAEGIDTEHLFGFMIGSDIGERGEREFQSQTTGRFARSGGRYRAGEQEFELEFVPANNFRIEMGSAFAAHNINGVPGFDDRRQAAWQGASLDFRYRFWDRQAAPFGVTFDVETRFDRLDEISGARARKYGAGFTLALDRELVPNYLVAALNLLYQPEWTRFAKSDLSEQEATMGVAAAVMARIGPDVLLGGEARYLRKYEDLGLHELAGQALFVGPTAYFQLSERSRLTAAWSIQAWGRSAEGVGALDLGNFERHQVRMVYGVSF